uniref:Myosin tail domain-containing protein n=1 Tax=Timema bartmani TaxID=61472 RepID=A0A7R9EP88_9NEOP|nr:unnamed protein product [Timema bartmani]
MGRNGCESWLGALRLISIKQVEKLEVHIQEISVRIEELNRTIVDITSHKTRLSQENLELTKEVQDLKQHLENSTYLKSQLAGQLEDARRRLEDDERRRSSLEANLHQVEIELESVRVQLEEESEARLDLERQLSRANGEVTVYRSKYETEAAARIEEVEEIRRKYTVRLQEQEEQIETLLVKVNNLEKQKSRLQSEVEVFIIDLEKANNTARELQKRVEHLEKINIDIKTRLDETILLYENSQRDVRNKQTEIQRITHELDKTREQKESLTRENKKLSDDLHDAKNQISDLTRRLHELELELRRLENEREELTAAYKEAEADYVPTMLLPCYERHGTVGAQSCKVKASKGWQKPPTRLYEDNYGFGINFYQPMIDYLDAKEEKRTPKEYPHLPWSDERGLERYSSKKLVKAYSEKDLRRLAEARTKVDHGANTLTKQKTNLSLTETASAVSAIKRKGSTKGEVRVKKMSEEVFDDNVEQLAGALRSAKAYAIGKSAKAIESHLLAESLRNLSSNTEVDIRSFQRRAEVKQTSIEIEQLNSRVVEAETRLKTEVTRIKKKLHIQITELEMSLDVANKNNIELQKTIKKQSLTLTVIAHCPVHSQELQAHYDEVQRQLQVTLDQYGIAQRRLQSLTAEVEEIRGNYEQALRIKKSVEIQLEESVSRINELTVINVNLSSSKSKIEQELSVLASDYDEVTRELRVSDERFQRVQVELKHTVEVLHEEQERIVKIDAIKKSLEIEVKNLSVRLEEVEANAIVGGKRIISKLEARIRDIELELDEEKRRHAETLKILRKKERSYKEIIIQSEEDRQNISLLQETLDKVNQKVNIYKRQLQETVTYPGPELEEGMSQQSVTRSRRFQRELEAAEDRADTAESNLHLIRAKHRTFVTTSTVPGSQVYLVQETQRHTTTTSEGY